MIKLKYFYILILLTFSLNVFAQSGTYIRENYPTDADGTKLKWTISLQPNGTFLYHFFRNHLGSVNQEENYYAKGTWKIEGKVILFFSKIGDDINKKFTVNLNNSKARYITKSPRDKTNRIVKTAIRFFDSETFHSPGLELFKE